MASIYGSGNLEPFGIKRIGAIWFLLALSLATYIMNIVLEKKYAYIYVAVIAYIGYKTSRYIYLPFSIQSGMVGLLFLYIGVVARKYNVLNIKISLIWYIIFTMLILVSAKLGITVSMTTNTYKYGVLSIIVATLASFLCIKFSEFIENHTKAIKRLFAFIGENSLICLCVHLISLDCFNWQRVFMIFGIKHFTIANIIVNLIWVVFMLGTIKILPKLLNKYKNYKVLQGGIK